MTITKEMILKKVSKARHGTVTDDLVDSINLLIADEGEDVKEQIVDSFITYGRVLESGKYTIDQYTRAIKYITYKMMDYDNITSYEHAYPERYSKHIKKYRDLGYTIDECRTKIGSIVSGVAHSKLVTTIMTQIRIPTKMLNLGVLQQAINVEIDLMNNSRSDMVKHSAAKTLIEYLGTSDENAIEIPLNTSNQSEVIEQYEQVFLKMANTQLDLMSKGADVKSITNTSILEAEVED